MDVPAQPSQPQPGQQCIFCQIISGQIPSKKVYEDDVVLALLDIRPATLGHILLLPKTHAAVMPQLPPDVVGKMGLVAKMISKTLLRIFKCGGITIFVANGSGAGQKAPHAMMHIIPRQEGDGLPLQLAENEVSPEYLQKLKDKISGGTPGAATPSLQFQHQPPVDPLIQHQAEVNHQEKEEEKEDGDAREESQDSDQEPEERQEGGENDGEVDIDFLDQLFR